MKFTKEQKEKIRQLRNEFAITAKEQEKKFNKLADELGVSSDNDYLFDYVYSGFGSIKTIEQNGQVKMQ